MAFWSRLFGRGKAQLPDPDDGARRLWIPRRPAGVHVDHDTALTYSAVWACVRVISEALAVMPWHVYRQTAAGREMMPSSPVNRILHVRANEETTAYAFRQFMVSSMMLWGNGYAEIVRDKAGRPVELIQLKPARVNIDRDQAGTLVYEISEQAGPNVVLPADSVLHFHGLGGDGLSGHSVVSMAARAIGLGLGIETFGSAFFENGTQMGGVIKAPTALSDPARENLVKSLKEQHGGPSQAFQPLLLEEGLEWQQLGVPPEDAQYLESRKFQVTEIARWYRVPPHKIGDLERATFTNIEHQDLEFVSDSLLPWVVNLEQEANFKLLRDPRLFTKMNMAVHLRADSKARAEFYAKMFSIGVFTVNEIRALEDMNPVGPDGDKRFVPLNMVTLDRAGEDAASATGNLPPEQQETTDTPAGQDDEDVMDWTTMRRLLNSAKGTDNAKL